MSYNSLETKKKTIPSITAISPMNLKNHGILVADAERIKRIPNINGKADRTFWSIFLNRLLTNFWVLSV